jgi:hypothetical protein
MGRGNAPFVRTSMGRGNAPFAGRVWAISRVLMCSVGKPRTLISDFQFTITAFGTIIKCGP